MLSGLCCSSCRRSCACLALAPWGRCEVRRADWLPGAPLGRTPQRTHATMSSGVRDVRACWRADGWLSRGDAPSGERREWLGLLSSVLERSVDEAASSSGQAASRSRFMRLHETWS